MADQPYETTDLGRLADHMAELTHQLRHFAADAPESSCAPVVLARLSVAARLWSTLGQTEGQTDLMTFTARLDELVAAWKDLDAQGPVDLLPALDRLADWLEDLLKRLDEGEVVADLATDPGWALILATFCDAQTPLAILNDLEDRLRVWAGRWCDADMSSSDEHLLHERWLTLRAYADALLSPSATQTEDLVSVDPSVVTIILLVDSPMRRDQLRQKLQGLEANIEIARDPVQALELWRQLGARAVLSDNLEPTNHLLRLRELVSTDADTSGIAADPTVILVAGTARWGTERDQKRARKLGARGVWFEPYAASELWDMLTPL